MIERILSIPMEYEAKVENDVWKLKLMRPRDRTTAASLCARLLNLAPLESVSSADYSRALSLATLQTILVEAPKWFTEDKTIKGAFEEFPDEEYMEELYEHHIKNEAAFTEAKKKCKSGTGSKKRTVDSSESSL